MLARIARQHALRLVAVGICLVGVGLLHPERLRAADALQDATSLKFVPEDAAFYGTGLRLREQFDVLVNSRAFKRLMEMPVVKQAIAEIGKQAEQSGGQNPLQALEQIRQTPDGQKLLDMLADIVSNEIFIYGDERCGELAALFGKLNSVNRFSGLDTATGSDPQERLYPILEELNRERENLHVPGILIGFKVSAPEQVKTHLEQLEGLAALMLSNKPELTERFKREKIGDVEYLVLRLDGSMLPWDDIPIADIEKTPGEFDELVAALKKMPLTVTLGVRDDYLLLGVDESGNIVKKNPEAKLLYDTKEFAALKPHADKKICSISYMSAGLAARIDQSRQQLDDLVGMVEGLEPLLPFDDSVRDELIKDLKSFRDRLAKLLPKPGAQMAFAYLNGRGYEGYAYNWSENKMLDGSKPLSLLDHVGGNPMMFYAGRTKYSPENYTLMTDFLKRAFYYGEQYALAQMEEAQRNEYNEYRTVATDFLKRIDQATSQKVIPALKDGQGAIVADAQSKSRSWHFLMPPTDAELPMLELGLVYGVSDEKLLREGFTEYFDALQDLLNALNERDPDRFQQLTIPDAITEKSGDGTVYHFEAFGMLGADPQLMPNAGLSPSVAVVSLTPGQTKRLLESKSIEIDGGPLADRERPLATAARCNWPAFIDAVTPWVEYAVKLKMPEAEEQAQAGDGESKVVQAGAQDDDADGKPADDADANGGTDLKSILEQIHTGAEILKCFRGYSSVSYIEEGKLVTHFESVFQDLKE